MDIFNARAAPPPYMLTKEFYTMVKKATKERGYVLINLVARASFSDIYSSTQYNTIINVFSQCIFHMPSFTFKFDIEDNINAICRNNKPNNKIYTDDKNPSGFDALKR